MNRRIFFWSVILGAALGQALAVWLGPKYLVWYFTPPAATPFDCSPPIQWALSRMRMVLLYGMAGGALLGAFAAIAIWRRRSRSQLS